jgi:hypothetical protein
MLFIGMGYDPVDASLMMSRRLSLLQILVGFVVVAHLLMEDTSIPVDVVCKMVMQTIEEYDLPPLTGKCRCQQSLSPSNHSKRARIMTINMPKTVFSVTGLVSWLDSMIGYFSIHSGASVIWLMLSSIIWHTEIASGHKLYEGQERKQSTLM